MVSGGSCVREVRSESRMGTVELGQLSPVLGMGTVDFIVASSTGLGFCG